MAQCFSSALTVPFPTAGVGLIGNAAMTAWPIKSCTKNSDCATGTECGNSLGLSAEMIKLDDPYDLLVYGEDTAARGSAAASCGSTKGTDNKGVAKVIEYFTGAAQDPTNFAFCMPKFEQPNLEAIFEQAGDYESKPLYKVNGLASYDGVLPGITDQPNVVISFPPADSEVCVCVCVYVSVSLSFSVSLSARARAHVSVCTYVHTYENLHNIVLVCIVLYIRTRTHTHRPTPGHKRRSGESSGQASIWQPAAR